MKIIYYHYLGKINCLSIGPAVHIEEFVNSMRNLGHEILVFPSIQYNTDSAVPRISEFTKYVKQFKILLYNLKRFWKECQIVKNKKPDILITRYSIFCISTLVVAKIFGLPIIFEVNAPGMYEISKLQKEFFYLPIFTNIIEKAVFRCANALIVVSEDLKQFLIGMGIQKHKIFVVPNGVDIKKFMRIEKDSRLVKKFRLDEETVVIGFIGSFNHWHALDQLLDSFQIILKKCKKPVFILVGDGFGKAILQEKVRKLGIQDRVHFTGMISHSFIPNILSVMDIVLAPYPQLDFFYFSPLKLFEYMASEKPVITTNLGQIQRVIKNGENGFLYQPDNTQGFEETLMKLIKDKQLRINIGHRARKTVCQYYTWAICAKRVEAICQQII